MFSRASSTILRRAVVRPTPFLGTTCKLVAPRSMVTVGEALTAEDAREVSGYSSIDYTINEDATVYDVVQKFAAFNIGCLVVTDSTGNMTGIISERDYVCKVALLGRKSKETAVKEIATQAAKLVTAKTDASVEECMEKMLKGDIRHLPLVDEDDKVVGMISIKDLVKTVVKEKEQTIKVLSDFALGKGGHFGSD
ncbi:CBS domain-containing protein [Seminavis robusta]|uniref:CBS domain-containing protein n=1 Tax=Seminavis robusta TaxID=568900 RepID=A0A9N8DA19_9STRA|nr:CBS domain-containing protein [Seminavis robusta]|eukprot:Sro59_g034200.1 CBS domain-containing protein (195) ;mRNA; r:69154-69852